MTAISEWGSVMRLARRACAMSTEEQRRLNRISDPLESSVILYTDDPTTALIFSSTDNRELSNICGVSHIEDICCVMGEKFPPAAHEAVRDDLDLPRIAALWFPATGEKCPRCRMYLRPPQSDLCKRCDGLCASDAGIGK